MLLSESISDNLRFLLVELDTQIDSLQQYLRQADPNMGRRILDRSGYSSNLVARIHRSCLAESGGSEVTARQTKLSLRCVEFIATELERLAELGRDCVRQIQTIQDRGAVDSDGAAGMLQRVRRALNWIAPAVRNCDSQLALKIGMVEARLSRDYEAQLTEHLSELDKKGGARDVVASLFLFHSIERMGSVLLEISEALISTNLGQPVNVERYQTLQNTLSAWEDDADTLQVSNIADTRSGSAIAGISKGGAQPSEYLAIFKDGEKRKVKDERKGVRSWHSVYPGLAPRILSYSKRGQSAALLIEHLPGTTFEKILLRESTELFTEAVGKLQETLHSVWRETHTAVQVNAGFMAQLQKRLAEVYRIHPEFRRTGVNVCGFAISDFDVLVEQLSEREKRWSAPHSVYIHGDFNVDNIIYDPHEQRINFIDLHRSRYMDYVQDVSVFMVSNYRLGVLDRPRRQRILLVAEEFYRSSQSYAAQHGDHAFELRLALGLARSFASSTRFILDKSLAKNMFLRARYLLEQLQDLNPEQQQNYRLPIQEIFFG